MDVFPVLISFGPEFIINAVVYLHFNRDSMQMHALEKGRFFFYTVPAFWLQFVINEFAAVGDVYDVLNKHVFNPVSKANPFI